MISASKIRFQSLKFVFCKSNISKQSTPTYNGPEPSYFSEIVRLHKSILAVLEDKVINEFPLLEKYGARSDEKLKEKIDFSQSFLRYERSGLVYPGADEKPDPSIWYKCSLYVDLKDLENFFKTSFEKSDKQNSESKSRISMRNLRALAADRVIPYSDGEEYLKLETHRFQSYEKNKKWVSDTFNNLLEACNNHAHEAWAELNDRENSFDTSSVKRLSKTAKILQFPKHWENPEARKSIETAK